MRLVASSPLLRNVLIVDSAFSGASGLTLASAAAPLSGLLGLPHTLVLGAGVFLLPYAIVVGSLGLCAYLPRAKRSRYPWTLSNLDDPESTACFE